MQTSRCAFTAWEDLQEQKSNPEEFFTTSGPLKQLNLMRRRDFAGEKLCEKIQLADGRTTYVLWQFMGSDPSLGFRYQEFKCCNADEEAEITDVSS